jgi:hypothetical protein
LTTRLPDEATLYLRVWVRHACVACDCEFENLRRFTVLRRDTMANATAASVEAEYREYAEQFSEPCPCPQCGLTQPEMEGADKSARHFTVTLYGFLVVVVSAIATGIGLLPLALGCFIGSGLTLLVLVAHLATALRNPNADLARSLEVAKILTEEGALRVVNPGEKPGVVERPADGRLARGALSFLASAFCFAFPALIHWPVWPGQIPGLALLLVGGSQFANRAYSLIALGSPGKVVSLESVVVVDESVPDDFLRKTSPRL